VAGDPIIFANMLDKTVKELAKNGLSPAEIRRLTLKDIRRFYTEHKAITVKKDG
jgi:hypothetical protein